MQLYASKGELETLQITFLPFIGRRLTRLTTTLSSTQTNGQNLWEDTPSPNILPPSSRRAPGRPKRRRNKDVDEKRKDTTIVSRRGLPNKCLICGKSCHNKASCPTAPKKTAQSQSAPSQTQPSQTQPSQTHPSQPRPSNA
ncbi:unnamed protein product [Lathyrus sativus]|nr:unnamed protein product [Lathyrus sativus]